MHTSARSCIHLSTTLPQLVGCQVQPPTSQKKYISDYWCGISDTGSGGGGGGVDSLIFNFLLCCAALYDCVFFLSAVTTMTQAILMGAVVATALFSPCCEAGGKWQQDI